MSERTEYAPGTPSWADHASPDPGAAARFYGELFGWETEDRMPDSEQGEYHMATVRGKDVAALGSQPMEGVPPVWNTYFTVASANDAARAVTDAGGKVAMEPFDVLEAGRMAVCADPAGAFFMVWEPRDSIGAELVNEPGTLAWNELTTNDVEGSKRFYGQVFGWQTSALDMGDGEYTVWHPAGVDPQQGPPEEGGNGLGGMLSAAQLPEGVPNFWLVYFGAEDADATAAKVTELGGSVMQEPFDVEGVGRIGVFTDPQGAAFAVFAPHA